MSNPLISRVDAEELEDSARIASLMIGEEEYERIREAGGTFQRDYQDVGDMELIELATEVVNGEYPEMDERFSYDGRSWDVKDFVDAASEASTTPFSSEQPRSEILGSTQLDAEIYGEDFISDDAERFRKFHVRSEPPSALEHELDAEKNWVEIEYELGGEVFKFADYVRLSPMEDFHRQTLDKDSRERVYWPE